MLPLDVFIKHKLHYQI